MTHKKPYPEKHLFPLFLLATCPRIFEWLFELTWRPERALNLSLQVAYNTFHRVPRTLSRKTVENFHCVFVK